MLIRESVHSMLASYKPSEGGIIHLVNMISLITDQGECAVSVFTGVQGSCYPLISLSYTCTRAAPLVFIGGRKQRRC